MDEVPRETVNLLEGFSSYTNLPKGSSPVRSKSSYSQVSVVLQPNSTPKAQVSGGEAHNVGNMTNLGAELDEEENVTEAEKFCIQREKEYPDVILKPEDANAWPELSDTLTGHDGDQVDAHYQNIDTLLVLSGLFSAVVTTLVVEAIQRLQQDPADTTAQLLLQISMQLSSLSVNPGFINSTYVPPPSLPFSPQPSAVFVNILWFISLALSLVTASLGMLVKQWLREYRSQSNVSPEQCCQVRLFRVRGLRRYKVAEIASLLPILLQIALILFFIGLILFARSIHVLIATVVSIIVAIWLLFVFGTTFLPVISPSCPYKTPLLKSIFFHLRNLINGLPKRFKASFIGSHFPILSESLFDEESTREMDMETKIEVLVDAYETFRDIKSWDIVMRCVDLNSPLDSLRMLSTLVKQKYGSEITSESNLSGLFDQAHLRLLLKSMVACLRRASFVARKDDTGDAWLRSTEVVHFVTLRRLYFAFRSSGGLDTALDNIVDKLTQHKHVFSVPHYPMFITSYILSQSGFSQSHFPEEINEVQMVAIIDCASAALDGDSSAGFKCSASLPHLLEICRISFLCAGRATKHALLLWDGLFFQLTVHLAESLQSMSYPEGERERNVNARNAFLAHCTLDMAMRLHTKVPGSFHRSLFQAPHVCSVKTFDLLVKDWPTKMGSRIRTRNDALRPCMDEVSGGGVPEADWKKVVRGEEYVGIQIRDDGNHGDEWYYEDLQSSCKMRVEFMWSNLRHWREGFRSILDEFETDVRVPMSG